MSSAQHLQNSKSLPSILVLLTSSVVIIGSLSLLFEHGEHNAASSHKRRLQHGDSSRSSFRVRSTGKSRCGLWHPSVSSVKTCTNDLDYPSSWNTLPNEDKAILFYSSYTDCCMDHFSETSECNIVDHCSDDTNEDDASIAVVLTTRRNQDYSTKDVAIIQPDQEPTSPSSSCSQWRPSSDQPGTCTNSQADVVWPASMFRSTHSECCKDFFNYSTCSIVDVCSMGTKY